MGLTPDTGSGDADVTDASKVCLACGMCCDGTLFRTARLKPDEPQRAAHSGFALAEQAEGLAFSLPCSHLDGARCTIYDAWRPTVCGAFRCLVLRRMEQGVLSLDQALTTVSRALAARDRLPENLRNLAALRDFAAAAETRREAGELSPEDARTMVDAVILLRMLDADFRPPGKGILNEIPATE